MHRSQTTSNDKLTVIVWFQSGGNYLETSLGRRLSHYHIDISHTNYSKKKQKCKKKQTCRHRLSLCLQLMQFFWAILTLFLHVFVFVFKFCTIQKRIACFCMHILYTFYRLNDVYALFSFRCLQLLCVIPTYKSDSSATPVRTNSNSYGN